MTNNFHDLITRMAKELDEYRQLLLDDRTVTHRLSDEARAALADGPAVPQGREPAAVTGQPSDEELLDLHDWMADEWAANHDAELPLSQYARAVLARWGHQPAPPADGEVAELVAWLREQLHVCLQAPWTPGIKHFGRAAELLQRQALMPASVSERLPGAEETTEDGEVWIEDPGHDYPLADTGDYDWEPHRWVLRPIGKFDAKNNLHWLPAHALPVPKVGE